MKLKRKDAEFLFEEIKARIEQDYPEEDIIDIIMQFDFEDSKKKLKRVV